MNTKEKITVRQALLLFITLTYTPTVRLILGNTARTAKQASWLTPLVEIIPLIILIFLIHHIYEKYDKVSFFEAVNDILGTFLGKLVAVFYLIWITLLIGLYLRYFAQRLVSTIYPYIDLKIFIGTLLVVLFIVLKKGIVIIAKMNEIFLPIISIIFLLIFILLISEFKIKNITPISYKDIGPIFIASQSIMAIVSYFLFVFIIGDKISDKQNIKRYGIPATAVIIVIIILNILSAVGNLGYNIIGRSPEPFLIAVKEVSLFNLFERIESALESTWILSDFIIISVFVYVVLEILKSITKIESTSSLLGILLVLSFFLGLRIAYSLFEIQEFSNNILIPVNIISGFIIPIIIYLVGKVRRKV